MNRMSRAGHVWRVGLIVAVWAVFVIGRPFTAIEVAWATYAPVLVAVAVLAAVCLVYTRWRPEPRLAAATAITAQVLAFSCGMALVNYLGLALHRPLVDAAVAQIDIALRIDWRAYVSGVASVPWLGTMLALAYATTQAQVALAIGILGLTGRFAELDRMTLAFMLTAIVAVALWSAFPSFGAVPLLYAEGRSVPPYGFIMPEDYATTLLKLHAGPVPELEFRSMIGLIGCPSFHTVMALLTAWSLRNVPWVGKPAVALNLMVLLSVPTAGGHHLTDMIAGAVLTAAALAVAARILPREIPRDVPIFTESSLGATQKAERPTT